MSLITNTDTVRPVTIDPGLARRLAAAGKRYSDARRDRDNLIRSAYFEHGAGLREIARLVGLSHPGVMRIVRVIKEPHHGSTDDE